MGMDMSMVCIKIHCTKTKYNCVFVSDCWLPVSEPGSLYQTDGPPAVFVSISVRVACDMFGAFADRVLHIPRPSVM